MNAIGNLALTMEPTAAANGAADTDAPALGGTIHFADGLFGFPDCRDFALFRTGHPGLFWLQSLEHEALTFLLADPFVFCDDYTVDLADSDVKRLSARAAAEVAILVTVTVAENRDAQSTVNLQGPLAINVRSGRARQVIVSDPAFGVRHPIDLTRGAN